MTADVRAVSQIWLHGCRIRSLSKWSTGRQEKETRKWCLERQVKEDKEEIKYSKLRCINNVLWSSDYRQSSDELKSDWKTGREEEESSYVNSEVISCHLSWRNQDKYETLRRIIDFPFRYLNPEPYRYKAKVLTDQPRRSEKKTEEDTK